MEGETLSCGTGAVASAISIYLLKGVSSPIFLKAKGGELKVYFAEKNGKIQNVYLEGNVKIVAQGYILKDAYK